MKSASKFILSLIAAVAILFLTSCKATHPINQITKTDTLFSQKIDSLKLLIVNQAIDNKLILPVEKSQTNNKVFDSLVNNKVDEILKKLNISNQSGNNSFELYYNLLKKQIEINAKVGKTESEKSLTIKETEKATNNDKIIEVPVEKPLNKWQQYLIYLGIASVVYFGFKLALFIKSKTA